MLITVVSRWRSYEAAFKRNTPGIDQVSNVLQERRAALHRPPFEQSKEQKCYSTWAMGTHCYRGYVILISCLMNWTNMKVVNHSYYMVSSMSRQDEPNLVLWLATVASEMGLSCPLGITYCVPQKNCSRPYDYSFMDKACSVKNDGWLLALFLFCM